MKPEHFRTDLSASGGRSDPRDAPADPSTTPDVSSASNASSGAVAGAVAGAIAGLLGTAVVSVQMQGAWHEWYAFIAWFGLIPGLIGGGIVGAAYGHTVGSRLPRRVVPVAIGAVAATLGASVVMSFMAQLRKPSDILPLLLVGAIYGAIPGALGGLTWWWLWRRWSAGPTTQSGGGAQAADP